MGKPINDLINEIKDNLDSYNQNEYFQSLRNSMNGGTFEANLDEHFLSQDIDSNWIEMIENTIIPIDNILRSPRKFIQNDEEIVQIEFARGITTESIKHLAQHTNMIASVEDDTVTPQKILNIRKEESYDTYENRFMKTLLVKVQYLLDKRMNVINDKANINNEYHLMYNGTFNHGGDKVDYQFVINCISPNKTKREELNDLIKTDVKNLTSIQRIERLRKIFYDFQSLSFSKAVANCALIKPPLTMTNLLSKNPDYRACVDLWMNLEKSGDSGIKLNVITQSETPDLEYSNELVNLAALSYLSLKSHTSEITEVENAKINEFIVNERIEQIINAYEFNLDQIKRVFLDRILSKEKHLKAVERRIIDIIREAIADETKYKAERKAEEFRIALEKKKAIQEAKKLAQEEKKKAMALAKKLATEEKRKASRTWNKTSKVKEVNNEEVLNQEVATPEVSEEIKIVLPLKLKKTKKKTTPKKKAVKKVKVDVNEEVVNSNEETNVVAEPTKVKPTKKKTSSKKKTTKKATKKATTKKTTKPKTKKVKTAKQLEKEKFERERAKYWKKVKKYQLKPKKFTVDDDNK